MNKKTTALDKALYDTKTHRIRTLEKKLAESEYTKAKHRKYHIEADQEIKKLKETLQKINTLVESKGGWSKLTATEVKPVYFNAEILRHLLSLCHPSKHKDSLLSKSMTQELLGIQKSMRGFNK